MASRSLSGFVLCCGALALFGSTIAAQTAGSGQFRLRFDNAGIASLKRAGDPAGAERIANGRSLGHLVIRYRMGSSGVREFSTANPEDKRADPTGGAGERILVYNESGWNDDFADLEVTERFRLEGDALYWTVHLRNLTHKPIELGDVLLATAIGGTMERYMVGHEWYPYWTRSEPRAPYLLMMPVTVCPLFEPSNHERNFTTARFEHADAAGLYIHSAFTAPSQFNTSGRLTPKFSPDDEVTWVFKFCWVADPTALQKALAGEGLFSDAKGAPE